MALACTWGGYADTNLAFSEFFAGNHTVAVRFMLQFPHAYTGPMLAVEGSGTYLIGQGNFSDDAPGGRTKLVVKIGGGQLIHPVDLDAGTWHHLAVTRTGSVIDLYLDGQQVGETLTLSAGDEPAGKLRFGKTTFNPGLDAGGNQFYGLLDDVAVFTTALSAAQIAVLVTSPHLSGTEADLLAGYVFGHAPPGGLPAKLARPLSRTPAALILAVSAGRNNAADAVLLPFALSSQMHLPFPSGQAWCVIQGFDNAIGSHAGRASFCCDLMLAGRPQSDSKGAPFYASAPGTIDFVKEDAASGGAGNFVTVKQADHEFCDYLHLGQGSAAVNIGDTVDFQEHLADVGDTGAAVGAYHLHIAATNLGEGNKNAGGTFVTIPAPYSDYEASDDDGQVWHAVTRGIPRQGQWLRRPFPGQVRYTAVWWPSTEGEIQVYGWTYEDYRNKYDELWPQGWRLKLLSVFVVDGQVRYTAVWWPSTEGEIQVYGWTYRDYRARYDVLWQFGWRLKLVEAYTV